MAKLCEKFESNFSKDSYEEFFKDEFISAFLNHMKIFPNTQPATSLLDV